MPCYRPLEGWLSRTRGETGKRRVVFRKSDGLVDRPVSVACGQCVGCRLDYSRQWAVRCVHEAQTNADNCFVTLTYRPEDVPDDKNVKIRHFQLFMKRFRKKYGDGIRYLHCGEYGATLRRPHYHACVFGADFGDKKKWKTENGITLYTSQCLEDLWQLGFCSLGAVTFESAAYVARYTMKKRTGYQAEMENQWFDPTTGELRTRSSEYASMSRGIGQEWFRRFGADVMLADRVVMRGVEMLPPRYYDKIMEKEFPDLARRVRASRVREARSHRADNTSGRLRTRETCHEARANLLLRTLE